MASALLDLLASQNKKGRMYPNYPNDNSMVNLLASQYPMAAPPPVQQVAPVTPPQAIEAVSPSSPVPIPQSPPLEQPESRPIVDVSERNFNNSMNNLNKFQDELKNRSLVDKLSNLNMQKAYLESNNPSIDLSPLYNSIGQWSGSNAVQALAKSQVDPNAQLTQNIAAAQKLYPTSTAGTDKEILDALKQQLITNAALVSPSEKASSSSNNLEARDLNKFVTSTNDSLTKNVILPYTKINEANNAFKNAVQSGDTGAIQANVLKWLTAANDAGRRLPPPTELPLIIPHTISGDMNKTIAYLTDNPSVPIDQGRLNNFMHIIENSTNESNAEFGSKLKSLESTAKNTQHYNQAIQQGKWTQDPFSVVKQNFPNLDQSKKSSQAPAVPVSSGPKAGDVEDGHQFKGGDPADPKNWIEVK